MMITQFYGLVQAGLAGLALSTARAGDPFTMSVTACGLGLVTIAFSVYGYLAVSPLTQLLGFEMAAVLKLVVPYCVLAIYLLHTGFAGLKAKPAKQPMSKSGRVMAICSVLAIFQATPLVFFTDSWLARFSGDDVPPMHETSTAVVMAIVPMWGICIGGGALVRLAIVSAGHTASIYAANRATAVYYAQLVGALSMAKTFSSNAPAPMTVQLYVAFTYFMISYFGGTLRDDVGKVKAK